MGGDDDLDDQFYDDEVNNNERGTRSESNEYENSIDLDMDQDDQLDLDLEERGEQWMRRQRLGKYQFLDDDNDGNQSDDSHAFESPAGVLPPIWLRSTLLAHLNVSIYTLDGDGGPSVTENSLSDVHAEGKSNDDLNASLLDCFSLESVPEWVEPPPHAISKLMMVRTVYHTINPQQHSYIHFLYSYDRSYPHVE